MIPALLETIGALSLLVSIAAKVILLHGSREEDEPETPKSASIRRARIGCFRSRIRDETHRARMPLSARCVRLAAGRAAFSRTRRHG
jgi:hypothetical protein